MDDVAQYMEQNLLNVEDVTEKDILQSVARLNNTLESENNLAED